MIKHDALGRFTKRHGASYWPEYRAWVEMKARCTNPQHQSFPDWGGRGITVCKRWLNSFEAFIADVGRRPSPKHSLDRYPNNDGNYEPGNVRWATRSQQQTNKRTTRSLTFRGKTQSVTIWARELGFDRGTICARLRLGWSTKRALTVLPDARFRNQRFKT